MAWRKGFFRAWLVLSAIWIGFAVLMAKPQAYRGLWKAPKYEIEFKSGQKITLDTSMTHQELVDVLDTELKREGARPGAKVESTTRDDILNSIDARYSTPGDQAREAWLITILPPAALLFLGTAFAWVLSGFRKA